MDQEDLFKKYITICNQALECNKDRFPYNKVLCRQEDTHASEPIRVQIINDMGQPEFHLKMHNGHISYDISHCQNSCSSCGGGCGKQKAFWTVKTSYLKDVVENAQDYIENPAKLNWEWINP
jgi:hypothetical protein